MTKIMDAQKILTAIGHIDAEIERLTHDLQLEKLQLADKFRQLAEEIINDDIAPLVYCNSTDHERALPSGKYYIVGLPRGTESSSVQFRAGSCGNQLTVAGKDFADDWSWHETKEDALKEIASKKEDIL